ncbi:MAG: UPF0548 protein [Isosphaeraceae bacterium]|jgi:uncharacterized protein (UPF0548 family)|nr:MAG: UPF0548 protein [Isosphaeraceae bacterium]
MVSIQRPTPHQIQQFLANQSRLDPTYPPPNLNPHSTPPGYVVDQSRTLLGHGPETFLRARAALERWDQFRLGWVETWPPNPPPHEGQVLAILAHLFGLWWLNACRITAVFDQPGPLTRFGLAYTTLPDHAGSGQERFLLDWDQATNTVHFEIQAISRPQWLVARLFYPYMRHLQNRFRREATAALAHAVHS